MTEFFDAPRPATAFDHDSTLVVAMELSGKSCQLGATVPGVSRRPKRGLKAGDTEELLAFTQLRCRHDGWRRIGEAPGVLYSRASPRARSRARQRNEEKYHASIDQTCSYRTSHCGRFGFQRRRRRCGGRQFQRP